MERREFDLSVSCLGVARRNPYNIVVLPWGATEPHNQHLPYLTDCILSHDIAVDAAEKSFTRYGVRVMVMPPVTMGSQNPGQRELPFCVHASYTTQCSILTDIVDSLSRQGFSKLVIINGHGGNSFKNMIRDLSVSHPHFLIAQSEWFRMAPAKDYFEQPGDHADEVETSVMMHYHPELVNLQEAGDGKSRFFRIEALRKGQVWIPRHWNLVSEDTGIGDPRRSTAEKGKAFAEACSDAYARFFKELADVKKPEDLYE